MTFRDDLLAAMSASYTNDELREKVRALLDKTPARPALKDFAGLYWLPIEGDARYAFAKELKTREELEEVAPVEEYDRTGGAS